MREFATQSPGKPTRACELETRPQMNHFPSAREAKEFLVSRIVQEATREGVSLSETERKMLYFSEGFWTLPNMLEVNDEFERKYNNEEYEKKIAGLIRSAHKHDLGEGGEWGDLWSDAISTLDKEDHYILVMVAQAGISVGEVGSLIGHASISERPPGDSLRLLATGLVIVGVALLAEFLTLEYKINWRRLVWPIAAGLIAAYGLALIFVGTRRVHGLFGKTVGWIFGVPRIN